MALNIVNDKQNYKRFGLILNEVHELLIFLHNFYFF